MEDRPPPVLHPAYERQLVALLTALDGLPIEEQRQAATYLGLWAAMETSRARRWDADSAERQAKILGKEA